MEYYSSSRTGRSFVANRTKMDESFDFFLYSRHNEITNPRGGGGEASCPEQWSALDSESPFTASSPRNGNVAKPDCVFGGKADRLSSRTRAFNQDYMFRVSRVKKNLFSHVLI